MYPSDEWKYVSDIYCVNIVIASSFYEIFSVIIYTLEQFILVHYTGWPVALVWRYAREVLFLYGNPIDYNLMRNYSHDPRNEIIPEISGYHYKNV